MVLNAMLVPTDGVLALLKLGSKLGSVAMRFKIASFANQEMIECNSCPG